MEYFIKLIGVTLICTFIASIWGLIGGFILVKLVGKTKKIAEKVTGYSEFETGLIVLIVSGVLIHSFMYISVSPLLFMLKFIFEGLGL